MLQIECVTEHNIKAKINTTKNNLQCNSNLTLKKGRKRVRLKTYQFNEPYWSVIIPGQYTLTEHG